MESLAFTPREQGLCDHGHGKFLALGGNMFLRGKHFLKSLQEGNV